MENKINVAAILRDCPRGTKLYSTIHGEIELVDVYNNLIRCKNSYDINFISFYSDGRWLENLGECILFPSKENRDWSKFNIPFKDGDIVTSNNFTLIYKSCDTTTGIVESYCAIDTNGSFWQASYMCTTLDKIKFATEEEKAKLFKSIKDNNYRWNIETKTLEKLSKFKDGDILAIDDTVYIYNGIEELSPYPSHYVYVIADKNGLFAINTSTKKYGTRFATEEEKNILFEAIKNNGYKWYPDTKSLVKLFKPIFKVGDTIKNKTDKLLANRTIKSYVEDIGYFTTINDWVRINDQDNWELVKEPKFKIGDKIKKKDGSDYRLRTIESINNNYYIIKTPDWFDNCYITDKLPFDYQNEYELIHSNKFDINTLKPFESRVLVRDTNHYEWEGAVFGRYDGNTFFTIGGVDWRYCIPYEGNEHLLGTTDDCNEYFKTWKS